MATVNEGRSRSTTRACSAPDLNARRLEAKNDASAADRAANDVIVAMPADDDLWTNLPGSAHRLALQQSVGRLRRV